MGPTKTFAHRIERPEPGIVVFHMEGRLRGWPECFEFQEAVREQCTGDCKNLVLDMEQVAHVDSTGVGILAAIYTTATNADRRLVLARMNAKVKKILEVMWFLRILEHTDTVEEAIALLNATPGD